MYRFYIESDAIDRILILYNNKIIGEMKKTEKIFNGEIEWHLLDNINLLFLIGEFKTEYKSKDLFSLFGEHTVITVFAPLKINYVLVESLDKKVIIPLHKESSNEQDNIFSIHINNYYKNYDSYIVKCYEHYFLNKLDVRVNPNML